jgi:hypothetical protein
MRAFDFVLATWGPRCDVLKFFVATAPGMPAHYTPNLANGQVKSLFSTGQHPHPGLKGAPIVEIEMSRPDCNNKYAPTQRGRVDLVGSHGR